jgi:hypothetical protein
MTKIEQTLLDSIIESDSKTLAAQVVLYRAIGINKEISVACMQELLNRRDGGDKFDFIKFIDDELSKIPKPQGIDYAKIIKDTNLKKEI